MGDAGALSRPVAVLPGPGNSLANSGKVVLMQPLSWSAGHLETIPERMNSRGARTCVKLFRLGRNDQILSLVPLLLQPLL